MRKIKLGGKDTMVTMASKKWISNTYWLLNTVCYNHYCIGDKDIAALVGKMDFKKMDKEVSIGEDATNLPDLDNTFPKEQTDRELEDTNISFIYNDKELQLFRHENELVFVDKKYAELLRQFNGMFLDIHRPIILKKNNEIIGLLMPVGEQDKILASFRKATA